MRIHTTAFIATLGLLLSTGAAAIPDTFLYVGDLEDDGAPANGSFSVTFQIFDDPVAGTAVFAETVAALVVVDGALVHELGAAPSNVLDDAELAAGDLYLSVIVNGVTLEPRVPIRAVPYAALAEKAEFAETADVATTATTATAVQGVDFDALLQEGDLTSASGFAIPADRLTANTLVSAKVKNRRQIFALNDACIDDFNSLIGQVTVTGGSCTPTRTGCGAGQIRQCANTASALVNTCVTEDITTLVCSNFPIGFVFSE